MSATVPATAFARIAQLASQRRVHEAFSWLRLHEQQIMNWQQELVAIAAPPFAEGPRAEWLARKFSDLGLEDVSLDEIGNTIGICRGEESGLECVVLSAHLDTVFPSDTIIEPQLNGTRLSAPGACDNGAGLAALLALAAAMRLVRLQPPCDLIFVGNVGEEGEGNLRGMRYFYEHSPWRERVRAHVVLDGAGHEVAVTQALGSRRYLVTVKGPGGHSWTDSSRPNPVVALSRAIARLSDLDLPAKPRTTMNVGTIEGGTSVNAIPERVTARFDARSTDMDQLIRLEVEIHRAVEDAVIDVNAHMKREHALTFSIENIGDRPAGALSEHTAVFENLRAVDRHLGIRTEVRIASTDANIPLSLSVPALSLGAGGTGGGIHTRGEWYDARGRELGQQRILLLLLACCSG
jgi:acetylornithine deacetylase/succinyl-diaminopimelate desuccinylase-like protein